MSSSFAEKTTSRTTTTADMRSAARSAHQKRVDGEALEDVGGEPQQERVQHEREQEAEHERERQPQRGEERRQHGVQRADDERDEERAAEVRDVDAGQDRRGHRQRGRGDQPGDDEPHRPEPDALGLPGGCHALLGHLKPRILSETLTVSRARVSAHARCSTRCGLRRRARSRRASTSPRTEWRTRPTPAGFSARRPACRR